MTDKQTLLDLAERCEAAMGADRELDALIAATCRFFPRYVGYIWKAGLRANVPEVGRVECHTKIGAGGLHYSAAKFTASLDAAMTLVPEGWKLRQMAFSAPCADDRSWHLNLHGGKVGEHHLVGRGKTPELALCAAALRARAGGGV
ncbi:hypothetical protein [Novosphingobium sp. Leaf2]|uniref:hypothetical protein n=1 Tax=Novosphingobium sp. Leaf2 TaxID=1735670 RepID=UPI0006FB1315|nr:hypothetical protein [Novosphingobium sp. Leaf2]KQM18417.1 hypothetical protein ASE49_09405 [Novosphingobium sp. Leaf2]